MKPSRNITLFLQRSGSIYSATTDTLGKLLDANNLWKNIFFTGSGTPNDDFSNTLLAEDVHLYKEAICKCIREPEEPASIDLRSTGKGGSILWIRWEFFAVLEENKAVAIECIGTDNSEGKKAELEKMEIQEKLSRERYLLRTLIDHLPDSIYVKDKQLRFIISNQATQHLLGASTEEETIGKTVSQYVNADTAKELTDNDRLLLEKGEVLINQEEYLINNKGEKKWLLTTRVPLQEQDDSIIGLVGISRDITDRKKIEETLRISIERFNVVSRATNDAIWDWDLLNNTIEWNDSVTFLFGYTQNEIGKDPKWRENHIHPDDRDRVISKINRNIEEKIEGWQDEYRFLCADGTVKLVFDRGFILLDENKKPYRMIGALMDITERKKLQDELATQLVARQKVVTEATIMAQEKEREEIGRELHDNINQILTTTKMYLDMALAEKDISEELILKSHENISSAIEEIRILSKSLVPPSLGDIGLKEAITEMIDNINISQKINFKLRISGLSRTIIPGNIQLMVFRIVQEQISNILKHSKATEAEIKLGINKKELQITITDNGIGFDTKKRMKGIGIMNITSRAEVHNGDVDILTSPGNGCTIKISIPL